MISFKSFLVEDTKFDIEKFKTDCGFFLKNCKGQVMYRGGPVVRNWTIQEWRERSGPRDSSPEFHDALNGFFMERFKVPARNWMFATGSEATADMYVGDSGTLCAIFPIGKFEWLNSPGREMQDLYGSYMWHKSKIYAADVDHKLSDAERGRLSMAHVLKQLSLAKWNFNKNLSGAIKSDNEIMFKCERFYALDTNGKAFKAVQAIL